MPHYVDQEVAFQTQIYIVQQYVLLDVIVQKIYLPTGKVFVSQRTNANSCQSVEIMDNNVFLFLNTSIDLL